MPPIPSPHMGKNPESRDSFMKRCMSDPVMNKEFKDQKQKAAVCFSSYRKKHPEDKKPKESKSSVEDYILLQDEQGLEIIDLQKLPEVEIKEEENKAE